MEENQYYSAILKRLQDTIFAFMDDLRRRTQIFEGRRSVEEQLSGEYHGRFLIELIQNADDACGQDGEIVIVIRRTPSPRIAVFNTGKGFTHENFRSLCTLGLTDKKPEEAIGNKGLGFRSVLEVCKNPFIFSSNPNRPKGEEPRFDGYCFYFDPDELGNALQKSAQQIGSSDGFPPLDIAGRSFQLLEEFRLDFISSLKCSLTDSEILRRAIQTLPVYEMPLPCKTLDPLLSWASEKKAATAVFLGIRPDAEGISRKALAELDAYMFLFLRNARRISAYLENTSRPNKVVEFERDIDRPKDRPLIGKGHIKVTYHDREAWADVRGIKPEDLENESQEWWFFRKPVERKDFEAALEGLPDRWQDMRRVEIEVAVPIIPDHSLGRFAIYLPTKTITGTRAWVNAPFYGKIDRTGIDWDRKWNSCLLNHTITSIGEMVNLLRQTSDIASGQGILSLLGITDHSQKLAQTQISSTTIQQIMKDEAWVLSESDTNGKHHYRKLSDLTLPEDFAWKVSAVEPIPDISCREKVPIMFPHSEFLETILKSTAKLFGITTKKLDEGNCVTLAETAIQKIDKNKRNSTWWNGLYRWLGQFQIPYHALLGKRLLWTQGESVLRVEQESRVFSPPTRLATSDEQDSPAIRKFQDILISSMPAVLHDKIAFLNPDIDLGDSLIRSFLIGGYGSTGPVRPFRTQQVADFVLKNICRDLYRDKMSESRKKDARELFAWTFILWMQVQGETSSVDWSQLLVPTTVGWRPANEAYVGKGWIGAEGEDLERLFQNAQPPKPFVAHPNSLFDMLPKNFQALIREHDLRDKLRSFIIEALKVWTAPRLIVQMGSRPGGFHPEFCPGGSDYSLDASSLGVVPEKFQLPIDNEMWNKYLQRIDQESKGKPFRKPSKYVLSEVACLEKITADGVYANALARCLGRGWSKYYSRHGTTTVYRHPQENGDPCRWNVTGFVAEQLASLKWIPMRVWATREEGERDNSKEFGLNTTPSQVIKVNKDLLEVGSAITYSLLPHIAPDVEQDIGEELCRKIGIAVYPPREVEEPLHIMKLLHKAHIRMPSGREPFLISLWNDMFDVAVSRLQPGQALANKPSAVLGFEVQKGGTTLLRWLSPLKQGEQREKVAWINDNEDSLSMLPAGTLIAYHGKGRIRMNDRVALLKKIMGNVDVRRLSELKPVCEGDSVDGWDAPRFLSDAFPWLIQPALAMLAFGRQTVMSISNPKGEFPPLKSRIQSARVQYVRNLKIRLEGMDVGSQPRSLFYSSAENLLLLDSDAKLRLRALAVPLTLLFDREDYLKPAELWLRNVEEAADEGRLREDVSSEVAIDALGIESTYLQELFQVIGGKTQQIIRSVGPALFAIARRGRSPVAAHELNNMIGKIADSADPYGQAENTMVSILSKSGVEDAIKYSTVLRQIAEKKRDTAEIAKAAYERIGLDLPDWNSSAIEIRARSQIVRNLEAVETFNRIKQDTRWAACGFLQVRLQDLRKAEFTERWASYDSLKPSGSLESMWSPTLVQMELPIIEWFKRQAADLQIGTIDKKDSDFIGSMRNEYGLIGKDPDTILNDNLMALKVRWKRLRIVMAGLALRAADSDAALSQLRSIDEEPSGRWLLQDDVLKSCFSVAAATEEELFATLRGWMKTQPAYVVKLIESVKADNLEELIKSTKITPQEEEKAKENLTKRPIIIPKQTIGRRALEIPEKDVPLDELRKKLDQLLGDNNQEILKKLTGHVDTEACTSLGEAPASKRKTGAGGTRVSGSKQKDKDFIGYVGEYLVFRAIKKRYPHIDLSNWVSGNKQKFYPGSKGDDGLGYDFRIPAVSGHNILIEVKSHTGDQAYFELGSSELDAAQGAIESGDVYRIWVVRNLEADMEIDHIPNPMDKANRKHFRFEVGRVYYQTE
jgi:hypothetical protein